MFAIWVVLCVLVSMLLKSARISLRREVAFRSLNINKIDVSFSVLAMYRQSPCPQLNKLIFNPLS